MDGYNSYCSEPFETYIRSNNIIPLWLPSYSLYITQLLDISCFSVIKRRYYQGVKQLARSGQHYIGVDDFLYIYAKIRPKVLSYSNIEASFRATGVILFNPKEVLSKLGGFYVITPKLVLNSLTINLVSNIPRIV